MGEAEVVVRMEEGLGSVGEAAEAAAPPQDAPMVPEEATQKGAHPLRIHAALHNVLPGSIAPRPQLCAAPRAAAPQP